MSWTLIEHQALTSSVASVTLGSGGTIPQTYKTLKLVMSLRIDQAATVGAILVKPNNDTTGANYSARRLYGTGSTTASDNSSGNVNSVLLAAEGTLMTANTFTSFEMTFPNYAGNTNKPISSEMVTENNSTESYQLLNAILWSQTTAITSLVLAPGSGSGNWDSGSTFTLYGLA